MRSTGLVLILFLVVVVTGTSARHGFDHDGDAEPRSTPDEAVQRDAALVLIPAAVELGPIPCRRFWRQQIPVNLAIGSRDQWPSTYHVAQVYRLRSRRGRRHRLPMVRLVGDADPGSAKLGWGSDLRSSSVWLNSIQFAH